MKVQDQNQLPPSESKIQQDAFTEIRNRYPETYGLLYHCPNGGLRDKRTASIMRGLGVVPGIQDLHFLWKGTHYIIEVKDHKGRVSADQKVIHAQHKLHGTNTYIFRTAEQIIYFVEYIIQNKSLEAFDRFISPYSDAEKVEEFKAEMRREKQRKLGKVA